MIGYQPIEDTVSFLTGTRRPHLIKRLGEQFDLPSTLTLKRSPGRLTRVLFIFALVFLL
jgi:hypothetical protein